MSVLYTIMLAVLAILAISGLYVGVTNDAVNFLNAAIGSKVAKMRTILAVASVGIIIGVITSSGMMEVARSGMFNPALFTFHEIMILYVSVMFANVILLDIYNSLGLPTSTTVALVFSLLGAAIAVSLFKISGDPSLTLGSLGGFINTTRAMGVISAILLSVLIAFVFGTIIMWLSRFLFSFRYFGIFRKMGAIWCGLSFTAIAYFAVFKALKGVLAGTAMYTWISENLFVAVIICWVCCSILLAFLQMFRINILRINILLGTFALALAFAGNDLVNFIGVPIAGLDAYNIAKQAGSTSVLMGALNENLPAQFIWMILSGVIMIATLWTSTKSMNVSQTEISLAGHGDEVEGEINSNVFSRSIVRASIGISNFFDKIVPVSVQEFVNKRFEYVDVEKNGAPYDKIRAVVNITTAALLISVGTSLKLPLSTTYVCFMVAMGSSLADKAWGRESAVHRISGVMTVVMGWFVTGFGAFLIAIAVGLLLIWGGTIAFAVVTLTCAYMLIKSNFIDSKKKEEAAATKVNTDGTVDSILGEVCQMMKSSTQIYDRTLVAVLKEDRRSLKELVRQSNEMYDQCHQIKYGLMPVLRKMKGSGLELSLYYIQVVDYLNEMAKALVHITRPAYDHIDNSHEGLSEEQIADLKHINDDVAEIYGSINRMINENNFADIDLVLTMRDELFERIATTTKSELVRINAGEGNTKASMFYLTVLTETKAMVLQARNLLKAQRYFLEHAGVQKNWKQVGR